MGVSKIHYLSPINLLFSLFNALSSTGLDFRRKRKGIATFRTMATMAWSITHCSGGDVMARERIA